jgi:hypothetical protein
VDGSVLGHYRMRHGSNDGADTFSSATGFSSTEHRAGWRG